jgi:hypothetical protein
LGHDAVSRFESKLDEVKREFERFKQRRPALFRELEEEVS